MIVKKPWGHYEDYVRCQEYNVKKIVINPNQSTSKQYHEHREETWVIVAGKGRLVLGHKVIDLYPGNYQRIQCKAVHQLFNNSDTDLVLIEIQYGDDIREDDITRLEDPYKRIQENMINRAT